MEPLIRILHLIPTLALGGAELYVRRLARGHDKTCFEARVLAMQEGGPVADLLAADGTPCSILGVDRASVRRPARALGDLARLFRGTLDVVRRERIDVIQTHLPDADWLGYLVSRRAGIPVLLTCHSARFLPQDRAEGSWRGRGRLALMGRIYPRAAALVAVGSDVRRKLLGLSGVRPERVHLVPSGIDYPEDPLAGPEQLDLLREEHAERLGTGPLLVSTGRLVPRKGFDLVLEAFARVRERHPTSRLWIVGDGPEREALEALAERLGLAGSVHFLGARQDVWNLLALADLFITGTRVEGLGLAAAEALAVRVPVVGFRVTGLVDVVEHGLSGLLAQDGDAEALAEAASELLDDPKRREAMGRSGRESARRFDVSRSRGELERIYAEVTGAKVPKADPRSRTA